eukprot:CAMPEP_0113850464 /NCGR_PEP_ID=MMETSP0372-20130328/3899_1 /TAXON_ID=340204 /ORGANISM="Lankesteria abbotti" /LENGTH=248 /DNA_ID=CAMNT_0000820765 /DNA_START=79 /DNA_END=822 /DNA_ORIENTATION=- /assembly_acc=CAM_ASM_000359
MGTRIMYLHGLWSGPNNRKKLMLDEVYGAENVTAPNMRTKLGVSCGIFGYLLFCLALVSASVCLFLYDAFWGALVTTFLSIAISLLVLVFGGRGWSAAMTKRCALAAQHEIERFRPNVVVASSYGAVVALSMGNPKLPMLLFTPAQAVYARYMKTREIFSVASHPYVVIVHPSGDKTIPLDDSIQLVETSHLGRTRLEVIEDDHKMMTLTKFDIKDMVDEVYSRGKAEVLRRQGEDDIDASLFDEVPK